MSVDSLKRPPTLLTIPSSFSSSILILPFKQRTHDRAKLRDRVVQLVIDDLVIVGRRLGELRAGALQAALDGRGSFRASLAQTELERVERRRANEDRHRVGARALDLPSAVHVDFQQDADAALAIGNHFRLQRPVTIAEYIRPFQKAASLHFTIKPLPRP